MNLGQPNFDRNLLPIMVTKDSAFELPESDSIKTHSEKKVKHWSALNQWPINLANLNALNITDADKLADIMVRDTSEQGKNSHLRSFREIKGYQIKTPTGSFGHLKSLIMETDIWKIKYLLVQKRELFKSNKNILISPANVIDIKWESNVIFIDLSREIIEESPDYQNIKTISDTFERKLVKHQLKRSRQNKKIKQ